MTGEILTRLAAEAGWTADMLYADMCVARAEFFQRWAECVRARPAQEQTDPETDATLSVLRQLTAFHAAEGDGDER